MEKSVPDATGAVSLLLAADDARSATRIQEILSRPEGTRFDVTHVENVDAALQLLADRRFDVMLLDFSVHEGFGMASLHRARVAARTVPVVVLTFQRDEELAVQAVRAGAQDYLAKGEVTPQLLSRTLLHAIERHRMMRDLAEAQQRQHFLATHDTLTKLPNRYSFLASLHDVLTDANRQRATLAVLFCDLDGFKSINDNLGHAAGDELLTDVARRMRRLIRKSDLVARLGGDEFVLALRNIDDVNSAMQTAEKLRECIEQPFYLNGHEVWVGSSIGISIFPDDGAEADLLIRCADTAMYQAKSLGKNQVSVFSSGMGAEASERFTMANGLRDAIHSGQLALMFQPQIDVEKEEIVGAETLVRWIHPINGVIAPAQFIGLAEETGLVVPLGEWVLRTACAYAAGWTALSTGRLAVNISGRQLEDGKFANRITTILEETGLPPERLEVELTESLAASNRAIEILKKLRDTGIRTAIDDFGTGYSSLTLLKRVPVDTLKIDRSFVYGAAAEESDAIILESMIRIARSLGMEVVAEGVETLEEMSALRNLGCNVMQGFLFSKPIGKQEFEASITGADALWRMPLDQPEGWAPPASYDTPTGETEREEGDAAEDGDLPVFRR